MAAGNGLGQHGRREEVSQLNDESQDWEVEEVEVAKPVGVVISVRLPSDMADRVIDLARRRGVPTSAVVREALGAYLDNGAWSHSSYDLTISSSDVPVTLYTGPATRGQTVPHPSVLHWAEPVR